MLTPVGRLWTALTLLPERAGGDCGLVGCAALDRDDENPIAMQCIRPAGHLGAHRFVVMRDLAGAEGRARPREFCPAGQNPERGA